MNLIYASDPNGLIGIDGGLPWRQRADLAWFKELTSKKGPNGERPLLIMGRKTFNSLLGRSLLGRNCFVVTRQPFEPIYTNKDPDYPDQLIMNFFGAEAEELLENIPKFQKDVPVWIIGGASIFETFVPMVSTIYHTTVFHSVEAFDKFVEPDVVYWEQPKDEFRLVEQSERFTADQQNEFDYQFSRYERIPV